MRLFRELLFKLVQVLAALVIVACLAVVFGITSVFGRMSSGR